MSTELGFHNVMFEVDALKAVVDRLAADGHGLVGGIGQDEKIWRVAYIVRRGADIARRARHGTRVEGSPP